MCNQIRHHQRLQSLHPTSQQALLLVRRSCRREGRFQQRPPWRRRAIAMDRCECFEQQVPWEFEPRKKMRCGLGSQIPKVPRRSHPAPRQELRSRPRKAARHRAANLARAKGPHHSWANPQQRQCDRRHRSGTQARNSLCAMGEQNPFVLSRLAIAKRFPICPPERRAIQLCDRQCALVAKRRLSLRVISQ